MIWALPALSTPLPPEGAASDPGPDSTGERIREVSRELFPDALRTPVDEQYTIRFEPSVYFAAPGGTLRLPGSAAPKVKLESFDLDRPRLAPFGELHIRSGDWRVSLSGFAVSLDDVVSIATQSGQVGAAAFSVGNAIRSSIHFATGDVIIARELGAPDSISGKKDPGLAVSFEAFGGVRFYDVAFEFTTPTSTVSGDEFFVQPIVGLKSTLSVAEKVTIDVQLAMGGFNDGREHSSMSYDILVGFMYRPVQNVGMQVGYRLYIFDLKDGPETSRFDYRGAVAGLYGGVVVRF